MEFEKEHPAIEYQDITQEEFDKRLKLHHEWLGLDDEKQEKQKDKCLRLKNFDLTQLDLSGKNLRKVDFRGSILKSVNLAKANLQDAYLREVNLDRANLPKARLERADLLGAQLQGTNFQEAYLREAVFAKANLQGANLYKANLEEAILVEANLQVANLEFANLQWADLHLADLQKSDFICANLRGANLIASKILRTKFRHANLTQAKFQGLKFQPEKPYSDDLFPDQIFKRIGVIESADFYGANLEGADFSGADLYDSDLSKANLRDAILHKANLKETKTVGTFFGGADLTNAILPEEVHKFDGLKTVEDSSRITRTLFLSYLGLVAFCFLTIASTTDFQLLSNSSSFPLPIFQVLVSTKSFYLVTPFIIFLFFCYFQIYLYQHYKLIAKLPAVFPDGNSINEKMYPWILNSWTQSFFSNLPKGFFPGLKKLVVMCLCWVSAPVILLVFLIRYLVVHDPVGSGFHYGLIVLTIILSLWFINLIERYTFNFLSSYREKLSHFLWASLIFIASAYFYHLPNNIGFNLQLFGISPFSSSEFIDNISKKIYRADFANKDVSFRAEMWDPKNPLAGVKGADLEGVRLEFANGSQAFLVKANLTNAVLIDSNFQNANFEAANLTGAIFQGVNVKGANFKEADLRYVDFRGANGIEVEQMRAGKNWDKAFYDTFLESQLMIRRYERMEFISMYIRDRWGNETKEIQDTKRKDLWQFYGVEPIPSK